jgi:hypothetical protein
MRLKCVGLNSFIHQVLNCIHSGVKLSISLYAINEMFIVFQDLFLVFPETTFQLVDK